jgi:hypothetical protein
MSKGVTTATVGATFAHEALGEQRGAIAKVERDIQPDDYREK